MQDTYIRFRCTKEFKELVEIAAKIENRSVSNYIQHIVKKEIENNKK